MPTEGLSANLMPGCEMPRRVGHGTERGRPSDEGRPETADEMSLTASVLSLIAIWHSSS